MKSRILRKFLSYLFVCALFSLSSQQQFKAIELVKKITIKNVGAAQGLSIRDNHIYIYGDIISKGEHTGIIREYDQNFQATGRLVRLVKNNKPVLKHPTGLTWHKRWDTFMGDTVDGVGTIYQLNWKRMWKDGNLNHSIITKIDDDAATNGSRPEFVVYKNKPYLASADYGDNNPEIRLYNPHKMIKAGKTSARGVIAWRSKCGAFNQNLCWDKDRGRLICVQNVSAGKGWCLDVLNMEKLFEKDFNKAREKKLIIPEKSELEGFRFFKNKAGLFLTSNSKKNLTLSKSIKELD